MPVLIYLIFNEDKFPLNDELVYSRYLCFRQRIDVGYKEKENIDKLIDAVIPRILGFS